MSFFRRPEREESPDPNPYEDYEYSLLEKNSECSHSKRTHWSLVFKLQRDRWNQKFQESKINFLTKFDPKNRDNQANMASKRSNSF